MRKLRQAAVVGDELAISFEDGEEWFVSLVNLRASCPCAACTGAHGTGHFPRTEEPNPLATQPRGIHAVGSYALHIEWQDGHTAGIYSFDYLDRINRGLADEPDPGTLPSE